MGLDEMWGNNSKRLISFFNKTTYLRNDNSVKVTQSL